MTVALGASAYPVGDLPPDDARLLQGAAVPRRRLGDHRHAPRPGHPQHGRPAQVHADHLDHGAARLAGADRHAVLRRLLLEGLDHRGGRTRAICRARPSPTSPSRPACSSRRSIRSGCTSWSSTATERFRNKPFPPEARPRRARTTTAAHGDARARDPRRARRRTPPTPTPRAARVAGGRHPAADRCSRSRRSCIGFLTIGPMLFGGFFKDSIARPRRSATRRWRSWRNDWHGPVAMALHALHRPGRSGSRSPASSSPGSSTCSRPDIPAAIQRRFSVRLPPARQQVLLRLVQRARPRRAARACSARRSGSAATSASSTASSSTASANASAASPRSTRRAAERLSLLVCAGHDRRRDRPHDLAALALSSAT